MTPSGKSDRTYHRCASPDEAAAAAKSSLLHFGLGRGHAFLPFAILYPHPRRVAPPGMHWRWTNKSVNSFTDAPNLGVKYFWKISTRGTSSTRSMSGFDTAGTASTPSISGLYTFGYFHTRSISGFDTVVTPCTWKYFGVRYSSTLPVLGSISGSCTVLILWILAVSKFSEYAQYTRSMSYTSTVSPPLRPFHLVFWKKTFTDGCGGSR